MSAAAAPRLRLVMTYQDLITRAQAGDHQARDALVADLLPILRRFVRRFSGNGVELDDLVQNVAVEVMQALPSFRGESQLSTWACAIAARVALKARKRAAQINNTQQPEADDTPRRVSIALAHEITPEREVDVKQRLAKVKTILAQLNPDQRRAWMLFEVEGKSLNEIATLCDAPLPTVATRLREARQRIVKQVQRDRAELVRVQEETGS